LAISGKIFISYRRSDTEGYAGRIFDRLGTKFGRENIFMDVDTIQPGENFVEAIEKAVSSCDVLIALIGDEWLTITDEDGNRRLDNPHDFVRVETSAALKRGIRVIPVLLSGTAMPKEQELPEALQPLTELNALEIRHGSFDPGIEKLESAIDTCIREVHGSQENLLQRIPGWAWIGSSVLIIIIALSFLFGSKLGERSITQLGITEIAESKVPGDIEPTNDLSITSNNITIDDSENEEMEPASLLSAATSTPDPSPTAVPTLVEITSTSTPEELIPSDTPTQIPPETPEDDLLVSNFPIPENLLIISADNASSIQEIVRWEYQQPVFGAAYSALGDKIALGLNKEVLIVDAQTGEVEAELVNPDNIHGIIRYLAFNPEGDQIVLAPDSTNSTDHVQIWKLTDGQFQFEYNVAALEEVTSFAISTERTRCAIGLQEWTSRVYECFPVPRYSSQTELLHTNAAWVMAIGFSSSGTYLASAGSYGKGDGDGKGDGAVRIWSGQTLYQLKRLDLHKMLLGLKFSPTDDQLLAVSAEDGSVDLIRFSIADEQNILNTLNTTGYPVREIAFSPNGELLAAGNDAGEIFIWRISDGELLSSFEGTDNGIVWSIQFSPNGDQLLTVSDDTTARIWGVVP